MSEQDINLLTNQHLRLLLDKARDRQRELQAELKLVSDRIVSINKERVRRAESKQIEMS